MASSSCEYHRYLFYKYGENTDQCEDVSTRDGNGISMITLGDGRTDASPTLLAVLGSILFWFNLYAIFCSLYPQCSYEWNCRVVSTIHAFMSASLCFLSAFILGPWPFNYIGHENNHLHTSIVLLSLGFFIFDFAWCAYKWPKALVMLAHHSLSIFGLCYVMYYNRYGCEITALIGGSEFTEPLFQLRWFLKKTGQYEGTVATLLDWSFVTFFLTARVGVGTIFLIVVLLSPVIEWVPKIGVTGFYLISFIFCVQLIWFLRRKYGQNSQIMRD